VNGVEEDFIAALKIERRVRPLPDFEEGVRYMPVVQAVADSRALNAGRDRALVSPAAAVYVRRNAAPYPGLPASFRPW
jgi:hypothetical protein